MSKFLVDDIQWFNETKEQRRSNLIFTIIAVALLIVMGVVSVFSISKVSGDSMLSTIKDSEYVICVPPINLKHGDIVTAKIEDTKTIIKRVVACPGDSIVFGARSRGSDHSADEVTLYLDKGNGFEQVDDFAMTLEGFMGQRMFAERTFSLYYGEIEKATPRYIITLDKGEYFLLGDNRDNSKDSRHYGAFDKKDMLGKVVRIAHTGTSLYDFLRTIYSSL